MGLCPLHEDHKPSFLVDPNKDLFYCYGCGRGGDVIRFAELYHQVKFPQALALLRQWRGARAVAARSRAFLSHSVTPPQRGGCLSVPTRSPLAGTDRAHADRLRARRLPARLADAVGLLLAGSASGRLGDRPWATTLTCIASCFRWKAISMAAAFRPAAPPHRFLAGRQGRLVLLGSKSEHYPEVILVEGLFDYAVLWQAGFHNVTCSLGTHLNAHQFRQLCDASANRLSGL